MRRTRMRGSPSAALAVGQYLHRENTRLWSHGIWLEIEAISWRLRNYFAISHYDSVTVFVGWAN